MDVQGTYPVVVFLDIETVRESYRKKEREEWLGKKVRRYSPDLKPKTKGFQDEVNTRLGTTPELISIVGMSFAIANAETSLGEDVHAGWVGADGLNGVVVQEDTILRAFWRQVNKVYRGADGPNTKITICTFNGLWFDLPVLLHRSAMYGIGGQRELFRNKPWDDNNIDVFRRRWPKSTKYQMGLKDLGIELRLPLPPQYHELLYSGADGSMVDDKWHAACKTGDFSECMLYGSMDIFLLRELARLWGGFFFPKLLPTWDELGYPYNYLTGEWLESAPAGWGAVEEPVVEEPESDEEIEPEPIFEESNNSSGEV